MCAELEHLKIETKLINATPVSEMGDLVRVLPTFALICERKAARLKVKSPPLVCCAG